MLRTGFFLGTIFMSFSLFAAESNYDYDCNLNSSSITARALINLVREPGVHPTGTLTYIPLQVGTEVDSSTPQANMATLTITTGIAESYGWNSNATLRLALASNDVIPHRLISFRVSTDAAGTTSCEFLRFED